MFIFDIWNNNNNFNYKQPLMSSKKQNSKHSKKKTSYTSAMQDESQKVQNWTGIYNGNSKKDFLHLYQDGQIQKQRLFIFS